MSNSIISNNFETTTGYWIHKSEFNSESKRVLYSKMSVTDFSDDTKELPSAIFEDNDFVYIPKINKKVLDNILQKPLFFNSMIPCKQNLQMVDWKFDHSKFKLYPHQVDVVDYVLGSLNLDNIQNSDRRACICLGPGLGKTLCSAYIVSKLRLKFIFIVYSKELVNQSCKSFSTYMGDDEIYVVNDTTSLFESSQEELSRIKGLFITHAMLRNMIKLYGIHEVIGLLQYKIGIQIKIYDEFDRECKNSYLIDSHSNFACNIYLSGTKFRSLKPDDMIFQAIYKKCPTVGDDIRITPNKKLFLLDFKSNPSPDELFDITRDEKTFKVFYNNILATKDVLLDGIMNRFYVPDDSLFKRIVKEDGQVIFFTGRISSCDIVKDKLIRYYNIDENDIGIINSNIPDRYKEKAKKKPYLVSTCQSLGRGFDSPKARVLVFMEFSFSSSEFIQNINRVGRLGKKEGYVIYPLDNSFTRVLSSFTKHRNIVNESFSLVKRANVDLDLNRYIYGYRKESCRGTELLDKASRKKQNLKAYQLLY